jgi:hypothetical protein
MRNDQFKRNNHYVPCVYLKRWESSPNRVWTYPLIVHDERVPLWRERSIKGIAYHSHLYTKIAAGRETDEVEKWLAKEFEDPAELALQKATSDDRLTPEDWKNLVRFLAAQDVRTPARLAESLKRWNAELPNFLEETLRDSVQEFVTAKTQGKPLLYSELSSNESFPVRVTTERNEDETGTIRVETFAGRGLWLFQIRRLLTHTAKVLLQHRWTILSPPSGIRWFTSDDPVIRLNAYSPGKYDFGGGWGRPGTEILLPLGPHHLLYTQVGRTPPPRGTILPLAQAELIRQFIAEHSHRMIFSTVCDLTIPQLRPRIADKRIIENEKRQWSKWNEEQVAAERKLLGSIKSPAILETNEK